MMGTYRLGVLKGDGIGPEVVGAALRVLAAACDGVDDANLRFEHLPVGWEAIESHGVALPDSSVEALSACDGWILGPHDSQSYPPEERARLNPSGALRKRFALFANLRPARAYRGLPAVSPRMDLLIVRENTEGFYADRNMVVGSGEFMPTPNVALMVGLVTREATDRIARMAFRLARSRRRHVSIVHKANVLRLTTGLFRDVCREVAREFPDVTCDDYHVDAMTAHLVRRGADFDVIVAGNMFGDILSDLAGELAGSLGMAGSINAGIDVAMAQAAHGAAPDIADRGIANPIGMIQSVVMLLRWLSERHEDVGPATVADRIERAVDAVLNRGDVRTPDLGGNATTEQLTNSLVSTISRDKGQATETRRTSKP
jgi:3-isopropylmalate dehydrogenase